MPPRPKHSKKLKRQAKRYQRKRAVTTSGVGAVFEGLVALQARLRAPNGCPWDREQTHQSLKPFLVEEAYEVLDAMDGGDAQKFAGELGDLLLQIVFHAEMAKEKGQFDIADVIRAVHAKMVRRHPHVFGAVKAQTSGQVLKNWEQIKAQERAEKSEKGSKKRVAESVLDGVPKGLPALIEAYQLSRRAANVGFDWENVGGVFEKLNKEARELRLALDRRDDGRNGAEGKIEEEMGDVLFAAVNLARHAGVEPEIALKRASRKFLERFQWMEKQATGQGRRFAEVPRGEMEELWNQSKLRV
ncbi:MAG TPA: nucleoside triphosphate pyrophosphohydrolase [Candidatus Acidoferrales bacterium]|nr:nucleoside triphosphate pyrophosphohydrolase [Candidatus Acidoferrales bacterium]